MRAPTRMPPRALRAPGASRREPANRTSIRAIALLGPISRAQAPRAAKAGPSAAMARVAVRLLDVRLSTPAGCACGGAVVGWHARRSARASLSSSPRLSERSAPARSEFRGAPRNRPDAGLPRSAAQGSQTGGRLLFGDFLLARQEKVTAPPGAHPGSRPQTRHTAQISERTAAPRLRQAQPKRCQAELTSDNLTPPTPPVQSPPRATQQTTPAQSTPPPPSH